MSTQFSRSSNESRVGKTVSHCKPTFSFFELACMDLYSNRAQLLDILASNPSASQIEGSDESEFGILHLIIYSVRDMELPNCEFVSVLERLLELGVSTTRRDVDGKTARELFLRWLGNESRAQYLNCSGDDHVLALFNCAQNDVESNGSERLAEIQHALRQFGAT